MAKYHWKLGAVIVGALALLGTPATRAVDPSISITAAQRAKLVQLVRTDTEAGQCFAPIKRAADQALAAEPHPIETIQSEGKLPADPVRIKTHESMADMGKLAALGYAYAVLADDKYAAKARQFTLAWAKVNHSAGDPIDDTELASLLIAYDLTRTTYPEADRKVVDAYLREIVTMEEKTAAHTSKHRHNNWNSHRLKIVGLIALLLHDQPLIDHVVAEYKDQVDHNISADGSTLDFHVRDALHYHIYDLEPLLVLATAARNNGIDLYAYQAPGGGSVPRGMAFLLPYAQGAKPHAEFVNSKVSFDRKRAEAGDKHYQAGTPFEPKSARALLEQGELFDPTLRPLIMTLLGSKAQRFPTWELVLNAARR